MPDKRSFKVGKEIYDIDATEVDAFLTDMPNAKEVKSFIVEKDTFDIPLNEVDDFLASMPNAKPIYQSDLKKKEVSSPYGFQTFGQNLGGKKTVTPSPLLPSASTSKSGVGKTTKPDLFKNVGQKLPSEQNIQQQEIEAQANIAEAIVNRPEQNKELVENIKSGNIDSDYTQRLADRAIRGINTLNKGLAQAPELVYNIFAIPQNIIAENVEGAEWLATSAERVKQDLGIDNEIAQYYDEQIKQLAYLDNKYMGANGSVVELIKQGNYTDAAKLVGEQIAESLPTTAAIAASGGLGASPSAITLTGGAVFGAGKYDELKDRTDLTEAEKTSVAFSTGMLEGLIENIGTANLGRIAKDIIAKEGLESGAEIVKKTIVDAYKEALKKYMPISGAIQEGIEEAATQMSENIIDIVSGVDPNKKITDGALDAMIVGVGSGAVISSPVLLSKLNNKKVEKQQQEISEIDAELQNPNISPTAAQVLMQTRQQKMQEVNAVIEKDVEAQKAMPEETKREFEQLIDQKQQIDSDIEVAQTETAKQALETAKQEIETRIDEISTEAEAAIAELEKLKVPTDEKAQTEEAPTTILDSETTQIADAGGVGTPAATETKDINPPTVENTVANESGVTATPVLPESQSNKETPVNTENVVKKDEVSGFQSNKNSALKDVESTAKALEGVELKNLKIDTNTPSLDDLLKDGKTISGGSGITIQIEKQSNKFILKYSDGRVSVVPLKSDGGIFDNVIENLDYLRYANEVKQTPKAISEAYHKAKADGSNPELVKAVESLLSKEQTPALRDVNLKALGVDKTWFENFTKENPNTLLGIEDKKGFITIINEKGEGKKIEPSDFINELRTAIGKGYNGIAKISEKDLATQTKEKVKNKAKRDGMQKIVLDEGNGIIINDLFNEWNNIKNEKDQKLWNEKIKNTKFGTYGTVGLMETIKKFNPQMQEVIKRNFYTEIESALGIPKEQRTYKPYTIEKPSLLSKEQTPPASSDVEFTAKGGNKVVDEKGNPLVLYHGTSKGLQAEDLKQSGQAGDYGEGIYFATDKREAEQRNAENIIEANVKSDKHLVIGSKEYFDGIYKTLEKKYGSVIPQYAIGAEAKKAGYTSIEVERPEGKWIIAFDGAKIQSIKEQTPAKEEAPASKEQIESTAKLEGYHYTDKDFSEFEQPTETQSLGNGVYFYLNKRSSNKKEVKADLSVKKILDWKNLSEDERNKLAKELESANIPSERLNNGKLVKKEFDSIEEAKKYTNDKKSQGLNVKTDLVDGKYVVEYKEKGLSTASNDVLRGLAAEFDPNIAKRLGYDAAKLGDEIVVFDAKNTKIKSESLLSKEQAPKAENKKADVVGSGVGGDVEQGEIKVVNGRELTFYNIKGRDDGSGFAVEKGSDGYVIQSAMIPMGIQRQGIGTRFYVRMNEESVKNTGNPLRSSDRLSNSAGKPFWENLVKNGYAEKTGDGYIFKSQQTLTEKQKLDREKLASLTGKKMTDAEFLDYEKRVAEKPVKEVPKVETKPEKSVFQLHEETKGASKQDKVLEDYAKANPEKAERVREIIDNFDAMKQRITQLIDEKKITNLKIEC